MASLTVATGDLLTTTVANYFSTAAQIGEMTCGFRVSTVIGSMDLDTISTRLGATIQALLLAATPTTVTFSGVKTTLWDPTTGKARSTGLYTDNVSTGSVLGGVAPMQLSAVIPKKTAIAGRRGRGRCFFPFLSYSYINGSGLLQALGIAAIGAFGNAYIATQALVSGLNTVGLVPVLLHRPPNALGPITYTDVTSAGPVSSKVGTQRKRGSWGHVNSPF